MARKPPKRSSSGAATYRTTKPITLPTGAPPDYGRDSLPPSNRPCPGQKGPARTAPGLQTTARREPRAESLEERRLRRHRRGRRVSEMPIRVRRRHPPARGALHEPVLHEERLVHLLDRVRVLADRGRDCVHADRASLEL